MNVKMNKISGNNNNEKNVQCAGRNVKIHITMMKIIDKNLWNHDNAYGDQIVRTISIFIIWHFFYLYNFVSIGSFFWLHSFIILDLFLLIKPFLIDLSFRFFHLRFSEDTFGFELVVYVALLSRVIIILNVF